MEDKQDKLIRAYAILSSLRGNVSKAGGVSRKYVDEFHKVLDKIEAVGIDMSDFRIPDSEVTPSLTHINGLTGEKSYTSERYVEKPYFLTKLDAVLGYFEIITSEKPRRMGFSKE